ncbi:LysR family transcriptional regulator [Phenylobacterium sp. LjRoot219]|uniref:LysR family transcriptional regulator n=1 Tax=Phenylobacterium sp. LjRoot219 TaxID=3342283 RepID=UPI003ED11A2B
MSGFTLHDLRCFDAVVREGGFQAAATALHRSHPAVFAAVARLEGRLGLSLLDRSGYRVGLTGAGRAFHDQARRALGELDHLEAFAEQLATGEEPILRVVVGDLCPPPLLARLSNFFRLQAAATRLHLSYETVGGPLERLLDGEADLILHRVETAEPRLELVTLCEVALVPVAAPGLLTVPPADLGPNTLRPYTQCVIRDTARRPRAESHFLIEGAHQCSAPDHLIKRELILQGLAWGHLPDFLIEADLRDGRLQSLAGPRLPGRVEAVAAARLGERPHGPVAERLWVWLQDPSGA